MQEEEKNPCANLTSGLQNGGVFNAFGRPFSHV